MPDYSKCWRCGGPADYERDETDGILYYWCESHECEVAYKSIESAYWHAVHDQITLAKQAGILKGIAQGREAKVRQATDERFENAEGDRLYWIEAAALMKCRAEMAEAALLSGQGGSDA